MATCTYAKCSSADRDVSVTDLSISVPGKHLIVDSALKITYGKRYALVAPNGTGKSTLLQLITTRQIPVSSRLRVYMVNQTLENATGSCLDYVVKADSNRLKLQAQEECLLQQIESDESEDDLETLLEKLEAVQVQLSTSHDAVRRASKVLHGLGFSEAIKNGPSANLSGG